MFFFSKPGCVRASSFANPFACKGLFKNRFFPLFILMSFSFLGPWNSDVSKADGSHG